MSDNEDLNINIGSDPSGVETGSKAARAAIKSVEDEANSLDRAFRSLRGSLDPLYAAQNRYNESLANSDRLLAAGRISEEEYAASVNAATEALARQAAAQLKGTQVANQAANALKTAARTRSTAETAANDAIIASARVTSTARAAEEARLTAAVALEERNRVALIAQGARERLDAARLAAANMSGPQRGPSGRFISTAAVEADRAAAVAEAEEISRLAQLDAVAANQKSRNAQRVANTREEAARRAVVAEQTTQAAATAAAVTAAAATLDATAAKEALTAAEEIASAAAVKAAEEQLAAQAAVTAATKAKAEAAVAAALAEEAEAKATADAAAASAKAALEARKLEIANRRLADEEARRVASANRIKSALDPAYAAQLKYTQDISRINSLASTGHLDAATAAKATAAAEKELESALKRGTGAAFNNRSAYEGLVMIHEALSRRWSRFAGSAMIEAQSLLGMEKSAGLLKMALSPVGLAVIGITVAIGAAIVAGYQFAEAQRKLVVSTLGVGAASAISAKQIDKLATSNLSLKSSIGDNITALESYTAAGVRSEQALSDLKDTTADYASLTGEKTKEAVKDLATAMKDPTKGAEELNDKLSFLDATQLQEIQTLQDLGQKYQAQALLAKDLKEHDDQASEAAGGLQSSMHQLGTVFSDVWTVLGALIVRMGEFDSLARGMPSGAAAAADRAKAFQAHAQLVADSAAGHLLEKATPEEKQQVERNKTIGDVVTMTRALNAEIALNTETHGKNIAGVARARAALLTYSDTMARVVSVDKVYHTELQRQTGLMDLQAKLATAKHAHNKAEVTDLGNQIFALKHYNELASDADLKAADAAAGGLAGARMRPKGGGKGPGDVAKWAEELHNQEILSKDYFKDQTEDELKFWQEKLKLTTVKSKEWLEVQAKIYELSKKIEKDNYNDSIADLKEKITEAKGDLAEEKKAWDDYLKKVSDVMGSTSKEFKDAQKEFRLAQDEMAQFQNKQASGLEKIAEGKANRGFEVQTTNLQSQQENLSFRKAGGAITDTSEAQQKIALVAREIALEQEKEQTISSMQIQALEEEKSRAGLLPEHIQEINLKIQELQQQHEDKMQQIRDKGLLEWQKANEDVALASMEKWKNTADAITGSLSSTFNSMLSRSITFKQAWKNMVGSIEKAWIDMAIKNLNTMIMSLIQQVVFHRTATTMMTATTAAGQVAQTGAVAAGTAARVATTASGAAAEKSINLLTAIKVIGMNAAKAASGAYAALAGIPIIGPILGAAAAVATFAAVLAFGAMISAAGGQAQVPYDGQITELHKDEMVLPAKFATPLRKQLLTTRNSDGLFNSTSEQSATVRNETVNSKGGDTHFTYAPVVQHHDTSWDQLVKKEGSNMRRWVGNQLRNGAIRTA